MTPEFIRARMNYPAYPGVIDAMVDLAMAVDDWRNAVCLNQSPTTDDLDLAAKASECVGDNHVEDCPCEIGRQGVLAAHDKLALRLGGATKER